MLALLFIALSVGLDNFGACTAIGVSGVDRNLRIRVAIIFGIFEAVMPIIGLLLGRSLSHDLGAAAKPIGGTLLGLVGLYTILTELLRTDSRPRSSATSVGRLLFMGVALSIDNLVIGFALGAYSVGLATAVITIAIVSVGLSLLGLELGSRLGERLGPRSELVGGCVLVAVGVAIGTGLL